MEVSISEVGTLLSCILLFLVFFVDTSLSSSFSWLLYIYVERGVIFIKPGAGC